MELALWASRVHRSSALGLTPRTRTTSYHSNTKSTVIAGYKAAVKNPHVSEDAKEHAREMLRQHVSEACTQRPGRQSS